MKSSVKIAVITGASSGMGKEFVRQIAEDYRCLDEIWVIARNKNRLASLCKEQEKAGGVKLVPIRLDLRKKTELEKLEARLSAVSPAIKLLVNAAGTGQIGKFEDLPLSGQRSATRLNCETLMSVTYLCLPYMRSRSRIIQMASAAAFVPQYRFAVYAASKAYVLSFSRALRSEVAERGITVTAVCPGPVDTPFFEKAEVFCKMPSFKKAAMADPREVVSRAIRDAACGKELSVYGVSIKLLFVLCKILPHKMLIQATRCMEHAAK